MRRAELVEDTTTAEHHSSSVEEQVDTLEAYCTITYLATLPHMLYNGFNSVYVLGLYPVLDEHADISPGYFL